MIAVIDYGMGNLRSVVKGFEKVGVAAEVTTDPRVVAGADGVVLPGVGAFGMAMDHLRAAGMDTVIHEVIDRGTPFLGICLGLQLLFSESEEFGPVRGLGILPGRVVRFFPDGAPVGVKIPHMGWNSVHMQTPTPVLQDIPEGEHVYFVHSFYVAPEDPQVIATTTEYGGFEFVSSVTRGNLFACQFHPEKSSGMGLRMLKNFGEVVVGAEKPLPLPQRGKGLG
ncbi:MAG: imidazole glycerol phosphate synthase subunit HisH [Armatimonadota bacterium]